MNFALNDEQRATQELTRDFAEREIAPHVLEYTRSKSMPFGIVRKMAEVGLLGGRIPEAYGGAAMDYLTFALVQEEISRVDHVMGQVVSNPSGMAGTSLLRFASEELRQRYLVPMVKGEIFMGTAITEPHGGTDAAHVETTAHRQGDHYLLNGRKVFISFSDLAKAFVAFAATDKSLGNRGVSAFIVPSDAAGFTGRRFEHVMFNQVTGRGELIFEDCVVPADHLLGEEGDGFKVMTAALNTGRLSVASRMVGLSQGCLDASVDYAKERVVFGQPIGRFQLVQSMITDMLVGTRTARFLYYHLAWLLEQNQPAPQEAAMAKLYASDIAFRSASDAVQIHGAYGCTEEYLIERRFRDAKAYQIGEGNNQFLRALIAEFALGFRGRGLKSGGRSS
ncbi:MAG: acyl-CoA dehydrogenase family protein [Chloroflexi bacterium]|nr:acyl-CoA dehydrogenase family protein [Chloroflexota bacterium]